MNEIKEVTDATTPDEKMHYVVAQLTATLRTLEEGKHCWPKPGRNSGPCWEDAVKPTRVANQASMAQNIVKKINEQLELIEWYYDFKQKGCVQTPKNVL